MRVFPLLVLIAALISAHSSSAIPAPERSNRALVAVVNTDGDVYLGWRLLVSDDPAVGFNVYRETAGGAPVKLNAEPITTSTNVIDADVSLARANAWVLRPVLGGRELDERVRVELPANPPARQFLSIPLEGAYEFNRVAIADLTGDGVLDYVIKQPGGGIDPGRAQFSRDTYKVEAYDGKTGAFLWRHDLGWNMNMGVWWTPMVVFDFDGDGRAEVALKTAPYAATLEESLVEQEGEARGFVVKGPEYVSVLDGMTGREIARADWVARGNPEDWGDPRGNRVNRNQIGVAHLDGNRASLLVARGTYTRMRVDAYNLVEGKLVPVWSWDGDQEEPRVRGQGSHGMVAVDIDDDGRDEVILGSVVLDDNGRLLWSNGKGHPDHAYVSKVLPDRPGYQIMYGYESRQQKNGIMLADARTGEVIWGHPDPTTHIHDQGMLADIDPTNPGMEYYGAEQNINLGAFMYDASTGKLLSTEYLGTLSPRSFWWLDGPTKMMSPFSYRAQSNRIQNHRGELIDEFPGKIIAIADVLGDWREELIISFEGELRIYTTSVPATSRRITLMQDTLYRTYVAHVSMGYFYPPQAGGKYFTPKP